MIDVKFDPQGVADHFMQAITEPGAEPTAIFTGLVEAISRKPLALSDDALAELKALVDVYKAYKEEDMAEAIAEAERLLATMNRREGGELNE